MPQSISGSSQGVARRNRQVVGFRANRHIVGQWVPTLIVPHIRAAPCNRRTLQLAQDIVVWPLRLLFFFAGAWKEPNKRHMRRHLDNRNNRNT